MIPFLIVIAVLAVITIAICSLSATITLVYDKGWSTKLSVLFIEKDIILSDTLSFLMFPDKKGQEAGEEAAEKKHKKSKKHADEAVEETVSAEEEASENAEIEATLKALDEKKTEETEEEEKKPSKPNPIQKIWNEEGIVGILELVTNLIETANSAISTLFRGLHIYSFYVMILVGGGDADFIARSYGTLCKYYYPLKGIILNGMKVDEYDDYIQPDFIADRTEFEFQLIASISVGLLLKVLLKAGAVFIKNFLQAKKG
jgi:hypothetical protein